LCAEAGLVGVGVIAVDETKVHANASRYAQIAAEILAEADAVDRSEDERYGERRGDELPQEFATAQGRRGWLREAKKRLDERRAEEARAISGPRPQRLQDAKRRLEQEHRVECDDRDRRRGDGRLTGLRAPRTDDHGRRDRARRGGVTDTPAVVLADAGYWHHEQMQQLTGRGIVALIPPDGGKRRGARPGWDGGLYAFMRRVLATDRGGELYAKRSGMIEPIFADTKFNRRCDRFQRRGRSAARSEWRLITATHNLLKLHRHQLATAAAGA
jgi:hypothetical protein